MTSDEIEFLPKKYREKRKSHNFQVSRLLLIVVIVAGMSAVLLYQLASLHAVNLQVSALDSQHEKIMQLMQEVERSRAEVAVKRHHAKLQTFLDHPYPKSQIIAAIANPLPTEITITRLQVTVEQLAATSAKPPSEKGKSVPQGHPMVLDLKQLIGEAKAHRCTVEVEGTTDDTSCLYTFLASLHQAEIIESAKIESIDPHQKSDGSEFSNFTAHVKVKRGYLNHFETLVGRTIEAAPLAEGIR
ncbi:hypothetical protein C5Y96_21290 [Blastopirellula marina]|uniref:Uncharacterized protein n=1 Tax=Blastopirellula marina TaxID=124 RepID=A0A2S8F1D8_9BACT|nr:MULTISPECIES: hypothetical protein [Pirellulaceae]PQO25988.1 hypothetical protein C5Y96_21290 [Blastopirellula marina]RCS44346.1 hypothetical protein DTL36_21335 [Bremerella cremea]